jgi:hypothetical protein
MQSQYIILYIDPGDFSNIKKLYQKQLKEGTPVTHLHLRNCSVIDGKLYFDGRDSDLPEFRNTWVLMQTADFFKIKVVLCFADTEVSLEEIVHLKRQNPCISGIETGMDIDSRIIEHTKSFMSYALCVSYDAPPSGTPSGPPSKYDYYIVNGEFSRTSWNNIIREGYIPKRTIMHIHGSPPLWERTLGRLIKYEPEFAGVATDSVDNVDKIYFYMTNVLLASVERYTDCLMSDIIERGTKIISAGTSVLQTLL